MNISWLKPAYNPADAVSAQHPKRGRLKKQPLSPTIPKKRGQGRPPSSVKPDRLGRPSSPVLVPQLPPVQPLGRHLQSGQSYALTPCGSSLGGGTYKG